jgi:Protein of unknown function (DUF992)
VLASFAIAAEAGAQARVEIGMLTCTAPGSTGRIVTSTKSLRCRFQRQGRDEFYLAQFPNSASTSAAREMTAMAWRAGTNREPAAATAQR